ncbi:hypothetical protein F0919_10020 [Taibaiella lutea]|uniref:Uncharacterized protein n=2 Tax=Taibaiella lutea TaxID=2608001 RepID=A0A5M6CIS3_9BACT|nr:hypothetical protein F0919_10020 [Taibaiella lutea]
MMKLHFLCWSIKNKKNIGIVSNWINTGFRGDIHIWGVEPTVNRAIAFAIGDNLINNIGGEYTITERGDSLFKLMKKEKDLFNKEKEFLIWLGKNTITEQKVKELASKFQ